MRILSNFTIPQPLQPSRLHTLLATHLSCPGLGFSMWNGLGLGQGRRRQMGPVSPFCRHKAGEGDSARGRRREGDASW